MAKKIILLSGGSPSSTFMYNGLKDSFPINQVIVEGKVSRKKFLQRRVRKLGYLKVFGQLLFQLLVPPVLKRVAKGRVASIKQQYRLEDDSIPEHLIHHVSSVNSASCIEFIRRERPDLIIVNGTRIISSKVLNCTDATFVNTHAGITPKYRGVHGGYWALANQDPENCGVTVHLVDSGIDTGGVLYQRVILPTSGDNFITYPYLQIAVGIELMKQVINDFSNGRYEAVPPVTIESHLWYHPTIWGYLIKYFTKGVK